MKIIEKKIWPEFFEKDKDRKFDIRLADFDLEEGDIIKFREWNPETKQFTGREFERKVKSISKFSNPLKFWTAEQLEKHGLFQIELDKV